MVASKLESELKLQNLSNLEWTCAPKMRLTGTKEGLLRLVNICGALYRDAGLQSLSEQGGAELPERL